MSISVLIRRFQKSIGRRGLVGTVAIVPTMLWREAREVLPYRRYRRRRAMQAGQEFDRAYCIDTVKAVDLAYLKIPFSSWLHGNLYQPIWPKGFRQLLGAAKIQFETSTFIDFGCGKGRALALASEYPFRRIVGVEFALELYEICKRNMKTMRAPAQRCDQIEVLNADALEYTLPDEPLVAYLYNPFGPPVMNLLVVRFEASWRAHRRKIIVLYETPECAEVWRKSEVFREVVRAQEYSIFEAP